MVESVTPHSALRDAVEKAGSQSAFARLIGLTQASVWAWLNDGKSLPAEHVLKVEAATGVSRHDLRPDLYPREEPDERTPPPAPVESLDRRPADPFVEARR